MKSDHAAGGAPSTPIGDAFLSNCRSAALVSRAGSIGWLAYPRFASGALVAGLLDSKAGHFSIVSWIAHTRLAVIERTHCCWRRPSRRLKERAC